MRVAVSVLVAVMLVGRFGRPERQARVAVRALVVMFVRPQAVPMGERSGHARERMAPVEGLGALN